MSLKQNSFKIDDFTDTYGILLPKLFWSTVRKKCFGDQEKFCKNLKSLEQFIQTKKGQNNSGNRMLF